MLQGLSENLLLGLLPRDERQKLFPDLRQLHLTVRHTVFQADRPIDYIYFPQDCLISVHTRMQDGVAVETAVIGREGVVGLPVFLGGGQTASTAFCQVPGRSLRTSADVFRAAVRASPAFERMLLRYTQALLTQVQQSAACNRVHSIEERCARWLLMTQDRVERETFELTQEFLAEMLGVRRPRVSVAASLLQRAGYIRYSRGRVRVVDRAGLEAAACECYGVMAREYARLFEDLRPRPERARRRVSG